MKYIILTILIMISLLSNFITDIKQNKSIRLLIQLDELRSQQINLLTNKLCKQTQ